MFELSPLIKSLWRSKVGPLLIVLQLALSIAIVSNALFFITERAEKMRRDTGIAHTELSKLWIKQGANSDPMEEVVARDIAALAGIPGVRQAAPVLSGLPFSHSGWTSGMYSKHRSEEDGLRAQSSLLPTDHRGLSALGLNLIAGRNFRPEEIEYYEPNNLPDSASVIITQSLANQLFPETGAVNKTLYAGGVIPLTVVGVVEDFLGYFPDSEDGHHNLLFPAIEDAGNINYVLRTDADERHSVMHAAMEELRALDPDRVVDNEETMQAIVANHYSGDRAMIILLSVVIASLVFINMLGIVGITTFWVNQRRRQIGIRRALGATRTAIMRYFLLENAILVIAATAVGAMMAFWVSHYLVRHYAFELLPWQYLPLAGLSVLVITLAAAAAPARRASMVPPREAVSS